MDTTTRILVPNEEQRQLIQQAREWGLDLQKVAGMYYHERLKARTEHVVLQDELAHAICSTIFHPTSKRYH